MKKTAQRSAPAATMTDEAGARRQERRNQIKKYIAVLLGLFPLVTLFLPYMTFSFSGGSVTLSGWQIITVLGIRIDAGLVTVPLMARICVAAGVVLALAGSVLLLFKKASLSGGAYALSALTPLLTLLASSEMQSGLSKLNVNQITMV